MNILILEDSARRRAWFTRALLVKHEVQFAVSVSEALKIYPTREWDMVCLDHDLHPAHYGMYMLADDATYRAQMAVVQPKTGFHFAAHLAGVNKPVPTVIHTLNPAGQQAMLKLLPWAMQESFDKMSKGFEWDPKVDVSPDDGEALIARVTTHFNKGL